MKLGDSPIFRVDDNNELFVVAEAAEGTQGIRRQRLGDSKEMTLPTSLKIVRIYEEMNRVLAGRIDFNRMITKVSESFRQYLLNDIYSLWTAATADQFGGTTFFPTAGSYDEDKLLDLIAHVEAAANGQQATIVGTKKALRNLKVDIMSDSAKDDLYNLGYMGRFYGSPVVAVPQRHKNNSTDFVMDDDILTIIAGDDKPIKVLYEGDPLMLMRDPAQNADLTHEFLYAERWGTGIILARANTGIGRYEMT